MKTLTRDDTVHGEEYVRKADALAAVNDAVAAERERYAHDVHSCHANCTRAGCVNQRLRGLLKEAVPWIPGTAGTVGDRAASGLRGRIEAELPAAMLPTCR